MHPILLLGIGLLVGCADAPPVPEAAAPARAAALDPEMCEEHGVLEAVCTKCNPKLVAVFQAKGDWCAEHGFPESFCPICSPEQGGRPVVADVAPDGSPADGTRIRFKTKETAKLAGLEHGQAVEAPFTGGTPAVARLTWDATRVALVSARAPGVVSAIRADVGTRVKAGDTLALVRSADVGADRSRVVAARSALEVAENELARKRGLLDAGVSSQREVQTAEQAVASARASLQAIQAELGLTGGGSGDSYAITAPLPGVVTARHASVGLSVGPAEPLFEVVDPSRMWAELDIAERDLAQVQLGQKVEITLDGLPGRVLQGTIDFISPSIDPTTRTALVRVGLENEDGALRAQMYGSARIITRAAEPVVTVPTAAVQRAGEVNLVFVKQAEDEYLARRVRVLGRKGGVVHVAGGLQAGDSVVTTGSFLLKTETLKDSIGAGCCDVE